MNTFQPRAETLMRYRHLPWLLICMCTLAGCSERPPSIRVGKVTEIAESRLCLRDLDGKASCYEIRRHPNPQPSVGELVQVKVGRDGVVREVQVFRPPPVSETGSLLVTSGASRSV